MKDSLSGLRHSARLPECREAVCFALELDCTYEEQIEFIDDVIRGSEKMCHFIDELTAYFEAHPVSDTVSST